MQINFDWNDLKYFLELARIGKMTSAAKTLRVDHTTVSRRIATLETAIGAKLFFKGKQGYKLTKSGENLLPYALQFENASEQVAENIGGEARRLEGTVRIGATDGLGTFFIAPKLAELQTTHPDLEVDLIVAPQYFNLSLREAQVSVTPSRPTSGRLLARKMTDYGLQFYASKEYIGKYGEPQNRKELQEHQLTGYIDDMVFAPELKYMDEFNARSPAQFRSSSTIAQMKVISAGNKIGILPNFMARESANLVPILTRDYSITGSLWLLTHQDTANLMRVRAVTDFLQEEAKKSKDYFAAN
jgi:DNA-binding transcriptional LysR family regulator